MVNIDSSIEEDVRYFVNFGFCFNFVFCSQWQCTMMLSLNFPVLGECVFDIELLHLGVCVCVCVCMYVCVCACVCACGWVETKGN